MNEPANILTSIKLEIQAVVPGAKVILFGSRAFGVPTSESDWDILILTKEKHSKSIKILIQDKLFPISVKAEAFINLLLIQEEEWKTNAAYYSLRKNIGDNLIVA